MNTENQITHPCPYCQNTDSSHFDLVYDGLLGSSQEFVDVKVVCDCGASGPWMNVRREAIMSLDYDSRIANIADLTLLQNV